jgi:GrpB-like predicted nucleotidyltransferase (UPF0157 family)
MVKSLDDRVRRAVQEKIDIVEYDPSWPRLFLEEKEHLLASIPAGIIKRIEHFGSTAVPGLAAKPIIDMLVEVTSLEETRSVIVPILESEGYDYFWRPAFGNDTPPFYAWFIKRDSKGRRTHHIHMVESHFEHWDRLIFRDYLIMNPEVAEEYRGLKIRLAREFPNDRVAYTNGKSEFIMRVMAKARQAAP